VKIAYLHTLANFNGPLLTQWGNIYVDRERGETYIIDSNARDVKIYNANGMETFVFGDTGNLGIVYDLTVDANGDIVIISTKDGTPDIVRCNYRGEPKETVALTDLPDDFSSFSPKRIVHQNGKLFLADTSGLRIAVTDMNGMFQRGYDIAPMIDVADSKRSEKEMTGFNVDGKENMFFTISVLFQAFRVSPEGKLVGFGHAGSGPGAFGVVSGIVSDDRGYIYVTDKLKSVVLVFDDRNFDFQTEFGYRGNRPHNLIVPNDIDIDSNGNVYVSQGANRGISVFRALYE
jgi:DNA-binding beta-propeller fold protein YncE